MLYSPEVVAEQEKIAEEADATAATEEDTPTEVQAEDAVEVEAESKVVSRLILYAANNNQFLVSIENYLSISINDLPRAIYPCKAE